MKLCNFWLIETLKPRLQWSHVPFNGVMVQECQSWDELWWWLGSWGQAGDHGNHGLAVGLWKKQTSVCFNRQNFSCHVGTYVYWISILPHASAYPKLWKEEVWNSCQRQQTPSELVQKDPNSISATNRPSMPLVDLTTPIFDRDILTIHQLEDEPPKEVTKEDMDRMAREMGMSFLSLDHQRQPCQSSQMDLLVERWWKNG